MNTAPEKKCSKCGLVKQASKFSKCARAASGLQSYCKDCDNKAREEYYQKNREKVLERMKKRDQRAYRRNVMAIDPDRFKFYEIKGKYGLSKEEYLELIEEQNECCAICWEKLQLVVDHCYKTKKPRALLCFSCNAGLGLFYDNADSLRAAADYIEFHDRRLANI